VRLSSRQIDGPGRSPLSQVNDRELVKLDKFTSLLSAANVNLGRSARHFFCDVDNVTVVAVFSRCLLESDSSFI